MPEITVLMSVYNNQDYLRPALESLLAQTWQDFELLVINDGSSDDSRQIIASYDDPRIRLVDNPTNLGLTASLNRGLKLAQGHLVARQDADDLAHPTRLATQAAFLQQHPDVALLGTPPRMIDRAGRPITNSFLTSYPTSSTAIRWQLLFENAFVHTSVMFRRTLALEHLGGYNEDYRRSQDYDLWSRMARHYPTRNLPEPLVDFRKHAASVSATNQEPESAAVQATIRANLAHFLHYAAIPDEWVHLISAFRLARRSNLLREPRPFGALVHALYNRFCTVEPAAAQNPEVRSYQAHLLARAAYHAINASRYNSFWLYMQALQLSPAVKRDVPRWKYSGLWLGGNLLRTLYKRLQQTRQQLRLQGNAANKGKVQQ